MELSDLDGKKCQLDAVDFSTESIKEKYGDSYEDCNVMRFRLDGIVYTAIEDPSDGYRSAMREINVDKNAVIKNTFSPVAVSCEYVKSGLSEYSDACDILLIKETRSGRVIIEVGTDNTDDYYPSFVASFKPQNISPAPTKPYEIRTGRNIRVRKKGV
jgi:hypothetical protein